MLGDFRQAAALSGPLFPHLVQRAVQIRIPQPRGRTQCPQLADKGGEAERGKGASWGDMALSQDLPGCRQSSPLHSALGIPADRGFSKERGACFPIVQKRSQRPGPTPFTSSSQTPPLTKLSMKSNYVFKIFMNKFLYALFLMFNSSELESL